MSTLTCDDVLCKLKSMGNAENRAGMARFGISSVNTLGVSVKDLRKLAKQIGPSHDMAVNLWQTGIHEARIISGLVDVPGLVTETQMDEWARDFDSWDVCDLCCMNLFRKTPYAYCKIRQWSLREEQFVKRAAFSLMATLAVHDKTDEDDHFLGFLAIIERESIDERNFVKKAVNWALRQIGKRNTTLNVIAIERAHIIAAMPSRAARWIARDALKELKSDAVRQKLGIKF